jgi:hypothetical protein
MGGYALISSVLNTAIGIAATKGDTIGRQRMTKQTRVDVLYDSLATDSRSFKDPNEAAVWAYLKDKEADVLEVQIDGERL